MANIHAEVDADISPFEKALRKATEKAREFAKEAGKTINDIAKDAGLGGLTKFLGFEGAAHSAAAFGSSIFETIKSCIEEAGHFETSVLEMGTALKDMDLGKEMTEWAEKTDSAVGTSEERIQALKSLLQSGFKTPEEAQKKFKEMADMVAGAGGNIAELAEGWRHMSVGQGEERTSGMQRLMKSSGAMEEIVRDDKKSYEAQLKNELASIPRVRGTTGMVEEKETELKRIQGLSLTDYVKEFVKPEDMTAMMANSRYTGAADKKANTFEGSEAQLKQAIAEAERDLAMSVLPTLTTWLKTLTKGIQDNEPAIKKFGEGLGTLAEIIGGIGDKTSGGVGAAKKALGADFQPIVNTALLGPANAVGLTVFEQILEHIKESKEHQKETAGVLKATLGAN